MRNLEDSDRQPHPRGLGPTSGSSPSLGRESEEGVSVVSMEVGGVYVYVSGAGGGDRRE